MSAYLYRMAAFVEWPRPAGIVAKSRIDFCHVGEDALGEAFERTLSGAYVGEARAIARRLDRAAAASGCDVVFLSRPKGQSVATALEILRGEPVLTVMAADDAGDMRAIINFVEVEGRIRFSVNLALAEQNRLTISSKLLDLAVKVRKLSDE